ncbi:MAG: protein-L-isoaspartate O-methyltransferase [Candidatus Spechtbacteria bacterium RIFCSPHIGHO2_02_FULL_43_15b]|uniref:Protein-L-isoaspartate O-methyltransferase n=1 Tax=Candidatus Spechtbacteria bacterium RIFCSPHIGHO2_01_FULL_43_30 TaxID=1802158 RepID=A0A1G2H605_9BACT|nr:MAG: protein-L-isoaspartate O-methyltransferase [Candidatus Spechtbacteria bacterium RIFCSPHIGHO2_01_FULL_43_30]OGZ60501.1 MAG: protein-L-isoaspartate O-methyltransferase [Candidatus Spechtbacteria bacterium RIFCSPHIGHO2_02_FULL_43_15b]
MNNLTQYLISIGALREKNIIAAFEKIDRKDFVLPEYEDQAYEDHPLPIGHGQTISQPYTVAFMLELLHPQNGERILDIGSGSGWTTALLSDIAGQSGKVWGVEIIPELVKFGQDNLIKYDFPQTKIAEAGKILGLPREAPFDRILVSAASETLPKELIKQLKIGGILVMPVKTAIYRIKKISLAGLETKTFDGFTFVPLRL